MKATEPFPNLSPDEQEAFEERAAIMEYDAGLTRQEAEARAFKGWAAKAIPHISGVAGQFC